MNSLNNYGEIPATSLFLQGNSGFLGILPSGRNNTCGFRKLISKGYNKCHQCMSVNTTPAGSGEITIGPD